jgi:hypothetical protein
LSSNALELQLGYLVLGGNKYRNMTLQVEAVSKIESMKDAYEARDSDLRKTALAMVFSAGPCQEVISRKIYWRRVRILPP